MRQTTEKVENIFLKQARFTPDLPQIYHRFENRRETGEI